MKDKNNFLKLKDKKKYKEGYKILLTIKNIQILKNKKNYKNNKN